ncbi:MAG TPA: flagellar basal-body MS-ring/collar protein FliF [Burkholderiaceae bacterium]|jgi:flagellar M-ring protein FliF
MAVAGEMAVSPNMVSFAQTPAGKNFFLMLGVAVIIAVMSGIWMWSQQPEYRILFSNYSDRDGGAIVASLQQMNIPYKFAEGGGAILVPASQVHDARLRLASQGLPKGGNVGFELMENQKLGVSQFLEQVNFQRALEGELARSIESIGVVQGARVHLALPKASVFVRDQQKPTASVVLNLQSGRTLDQQQVSAIVHLVASSVPDLPPQNISVIDQNGNLLSQSDKGASNNTLDATQLKYVQDLQESVVKKVESIITPIVGINNVRAEATADIDFSQSEQAAETYKPNQTPNEASVRSQQSSESQASNGATAGGVPGALSNQPPVPATAPLTTPAVGKPAGAVAVPTNTHKDMTVNYEVDKTVRYVQQPMGGLKRLSVAVVVNYKREVDNKGKVTMKPLTDAEKTQITDLVKEAMGFNKDRGDTLNVVNSPFASADKEIIPTVPFWKDPGNIQMAKDIGKYILGALLLLYLYFSVLKPMITKIIENLKAPPVFHVPETHNVAHEGDHVDIAPRNYQANLNLAKQLAKDDPKIVANVVKTWVGVNE